MVQSWILIGAVAVAARAVMSPYQKYLLADSSETTVLFVRDTVALALFVPTVAFLLFSQGFSGSLRGILAMLLTGVLNVIGAFIVFRALNREDASVVVPLTSLSPVVTSLAEPVLRSTVVPPVVAAGGVLSAVGAAVVSSEQNTLKSLVRSPDTEAVVLALSANFVFGLTTILDGIATTTVNPLYVSSVIILSVCVGSGLRLRTQTWAQTGIEAAEQRAQLRRLFRRDKGVLGCIQFVGLGATLTAISVAPSATQALILFKSNIILVVLVSTTRLHEGHRLRRTLGAAVIAVGTVLAVTG